MSELKTRSHMSIFKQVIMAAIIIGLANGSNYVWSIYSNKLMTEGGWSASMSTLPYTLNVVVSSFAALIGGTICEKFGPKYTVRINGILFFLGWFLCGTSSNPWVIILSFGVLAGLAQGMNPNAIASTSIKWAPSHMKGLASGIAMSIAGFSSMYMAPLGAVLLAIGMTTAFRTMGIICLVLCMVGSFFLVTPDKSLMTENKGGDALSGATLQEALKDKRLWYIFFIYMFGLIGGGIVFSQCAAIARVQAGWEAGYVLVAILALSNGIGRIGYNTLSDKIGVHKTLYIMFFIMLVDMMLLPFAKTVSMLIVCIVLVGTSFGGTNAMMFPALSGEFGTRAVAKLQGVISIAYMSQGLFGATLAAYMMDLTGSYNGAYMVAAGCMVVVLVLSALLQKAHEKEIKSVA